MLLLASLKINSLTSVIGQKKVVYKTSSQKVKALFNNFIPRESEWTKVNIAILYKAFFAIMDTIQNLARQMQI